MAHGSLSVAFGFLLLASACETRPVALQAKESPPSAALSQEQPNRLVIRAQPASPSVYAELPAPARPGRERCPDELLPREWEAEAMLRVRIRDARTEPKNILPLDLKLALDPELGLDEESESKPAARYQLELLVDDYAGARLFRRLNAARSEWSAGRLKGRIVVHDLAAHRVLCQAPLSVRGDATNASIRRRLRETTRKKLDKLLEDRVRAEISIALRQISSVLRLESGARVNAG